MKVRHRVPRELPTAVLVFLLCGVMALFVPSFRTAANLTVVGQNAAFIGVMACGEACVILAGGLDLSVGAVLAVASCAAAVVLAANVPWPLAVIAGLAAGAVAGSVNGALITYRRLPPILTTLATLLVFRYGISILTHAKNYGPFPAAFNLIGAGWTPTLIFIVVTGLFMCGTLRMRFGRWILGVGGMEHAAVLSGVPVDWLKRRVYVLSGICAGLAGLITMAFNNNAQSRSGQGYELDVIAACVVGGIRITGGEGSILGAALGAVLIALLRDALILTRRPAEQYGLFNGAVILVAALLEQWRIVRHERRSREIAGAAAGPTGQAAL